MGISFEVKVETIIYCTELLSNRANNISQSLKSAYDSISNLGSSRSWIGNQYDKVVDALNNNIDTLNSLIKVSGIEIPNALAIAAQNYAAGDGVSVRAANIDFVSTLESVSKASHRTGEIIYKDDVVDSAIEKFSNDFKSIISDISSYKGIFTEICGNDWVGAAMEQYRSVVNGFKTTAASVSAEINTAIISNVRAAQEALRGAESNTEAAASNVSIN